jgi:hypothetical protein
MRKERTVQAGHAQRHDVGADLSVGCTHTHPEEAFGGGRIVVDLHRF